MGWPFWVLLAVCAADLVFLGIVLRRRVRRARADEYRGQAQLALLDAMEDGTTESLERVNVLLWKAIHDSPDLAIRQNLIVAVTRVSYVIAEKENAATARRREGLVSP